MCVKKYSLIYKQGDKKGFDEAKLLEKTGAELVTTIANGDLIDSEKALNFVNRVEAWKAMGISERILGAGYTSKKQAKKVLTESIKANSRKEQITAFHALKGFGTSCHEFYKTHPAKVASAATRFLFPNDWGVVDWRSGALSECMIKHNFEIDKTIEAALSEDKKIWSGSLYNHIDADKAININQRYKNIGKHFSIEANADVDIFLFGISLEIWPIYNQTANKLPANLPRKRCLNKINRDCR
jgi:hypothetical protein